MFRNITAIGFRVLFLAMLIVPCTAYSYEALSWEASEGEVTGYRIYYGTTQGTYPESKDVGKVLQYSLSNLPLTEGAKYYLVVRAYNASVESENSNEVSLTVPDTTPPITPLNVSYNEQSANLEWRTNTEADLKEYRIYSGTVSRNYSSFISTGKNTSHSTSDLEAGTKYYFAVTAVDNVGNESGYSSEVQAEIKQVAVSTPVVTESATPEAVTPEAVTPEVTATEAVVPDPVIPKEEGLSLSWDPVQGEIDGYRIYYGTSSGNYGLYKDVGNVVQYSLSKLSLEANTTYYFVVRTVKGSDESNNSNEASWTNTEESLIVTDTKSPVVSIISPTNNDAYDTDTLTVDLAGTASDDVGVTAVVWANSAGGSGTASGTSDWSITGVELSPGINMITVIVKDLAGNETTRALSVTYTPSDTKSSVGTGGGATSLVKNLTPSNYSVSQLKEGDAYYLDREFKLTSVPSELSRGSEAWIRTRNDDKSSESESFLTFNISKFSSVYIGYDSRATGLPNWLSSNYKATGMTIGVSEEMGHFNVYQRDFYADTISIGGNLAKGAENASSNYIVIVQPIVDIITPSNYSVSQLKEGDAYYLDREFKLTSIPSGLSRGSEVWIKTRNDDKSSESESFLTFKVSHHSVVYIGYDSRATGLPSWLSSNYKATGMTIGVSEEMGHFNVYQRDFYAGTISIGGNLAQGAENASSNYIVIVQPVVKSETADVFAPDDATMPRSAYTQDDTTAPTIRRTKPTGWGYYFTRRTVVDLFGSASDPSGVDKVKWTNSATGISGVAIGKENWKIIGVKLKSGWNQIVITATDEKGNEAVNKLNVICWSF